VSRFYRDKLRAVEGCEGNPPASLRVNSRSDIKETRDNEFVMSSVARAGLRAERLLRLQAMSLQSHILIRGLLSDVPSGATSCNVKLFLYSQD
jgi:hypothetical protein